MPRQLMIVGGILLVVIALAAGGVWLLGGEEELPGITRVPAPSVAGVTFLDHTDPEGAREVEVVPAEGELTFLYFGFLSCPDVCPMTMADIAQAQRDVGEDLASRTTVAFVTVDPERDDGESLRSYLGHFFDGSTLALTAPDRASLDAVAERLGVRYEIEPHAPGDDRYDVVHSAVTYVIDERGEVIREVPFGVSWEDFAQLMRALL